MTLLQVALLLVLCCLFAADVILTNRVIRAGGIEVGVIASRLLGPKPTLVKLALFAGVTYALYAGLAIACWRTSDASWGYLLIAWAIFWRAYIVQKNYRVSARFH